MLAAAVALFAACDKDEEPTPAPSATASNRGEIHRADFHLLVIESLRSGNHVTHLRYSFQESPEKPVGEFEAWIDWANQRVRRERRFADRPLQVTRVLNGTIYEDGEEPRPMDEGFEIAALPTTTHLFQWLPRFPDEDFREVPHEVENEDGLRRYTWTIDSRHRGGDLCGAMTLDLEPERLVPVRSLSMNCPEDPPHTGLRTDYEVVEFVSLDSLPDRFFESSEAAIESTPRRGNQ